MTANHLPACFLLHGSYTVEEKPFLLDTLQPVDNHLVKGGISVLFYMVKLSYILQVLWWEQLWGHALSQLREAHWLVMSVVSSQEVYMLNDMSVLGM